MLDVALTIITIVVVAMCVWAVYRSFSLHSLR